MLYGYVNLKWTNRNKVLLYEILSTLSINLMKKVGKFILKWVYVKGIIFLIWFKKYIVLSLVIVNGRLHRSRWKIKVTICHEEHGIWKDGKSADEGKCTFFWRSLSYKAFATHNGSFCAHTRNNFFSKFCYSYLHLKHSIKGHSQINPSILVIEKEEHIHYWR